MKYSEAILYSAAALTMAAVFTANTCYSQVTLTVSPAVVSNTYPGTITLTITGLNTGEKIYIGRWLDLNGNGVVDAGEPLMDAFQLVDNDNSYAIVGGVTNINMPFDTNPANGTITTSIYLPATMPLENLAGHFVFQAVSPKGRFAPVAATFAITNAALGQTAVGTVYQSDGVTPFPNAVVAAQDLVHGNVANTAVADANGHYAVALYPGQYALLAALPNCYYNVSGGSQFNLASGATVTNNLVLTNGGPTTISGRLYDQGNSNGIAGMFVQLQSGPLFEIAFTDTNGYYSAAVSPGFWKIQPSKECFARQGYVLAQQVKYQVDATTGSVVNANIALPKGDSLVYGRVTDNSGNPVVNIKMDASTGNGNFDSKGYTDGNGDYAVAVLDGTNLGVNLDTPTYGSPALNYIWNSPTQFNNISSNQAVIENFVGLPAIGTISGHVQDNSGSNVVGVALYANTFTNGLNYNTLEGTTDNSGNYQLVVGAGHWNVFFITGGFSQTLDAAGYEDLTAPHFVDVPPTNVVLNLTVYPLGTPVISSQGFVGPGQFGFTVSGSNNVNYTAQVSTNLLSSWQSLYSFQLVTNSIFITDHAATNGHRFYRIVKGGGGL